MGGEWGLADLPPPDGGGGVEQPGEEGGAAWDGVSGWWGEGPGDPAYWLPAGTEDAFGVRGFGNGSEEKICV